MAAFMMYDNDFGNMHIYKKTFNNPKHVSCKYTAAVDPKFQRCK